MSDYIPPELIPNILASLPVDDVLRCTSICKSWYSLITSPSFISSHLSKQEPRLLIRYTSHGWLEEDHYRIHRDNQSFEVLAKTEFPYSIIIGVINGLCCLSDYSRERIMIWNPSLRKSLMLSNPRVINDSDEHFRHCIGFGFLSTTNDYKIVRFSYLHLGTGSYKLPPEVEIYELCTSSWLNVNADNFSYVTEAYAQQAFLNGVVHWPAFKFNKVDGTRLRLILSFDMTSEKFGALMLPNCLQNERGFNVSKFGESLCLMHRPNTCNFGSIWIMTEYGVADSWEKLFNIDLQQYGLQLPLCLRDNGDILFVKGGGDLVSYDPISNKVINVGQTGKGSSVVVDNYVESLVLINHPS